MHPASFPISFVTELLRSSDYRIYGSRFKDVFRQEIPTADNVLFLTYSSFQDVPLELEAEGKKALFEQVCALGEPQKVGAAALLFPLLTRQEEPLVALVSGMDSVVVERASAEWLHETAVAVEQEFLQIKKNGADPVTSLYNAHLFNEVLCSIGADSDIHVVLVELLPRVRAPKDAFTQVFQAGRFLREYNRFSFPLFHLGQSIFAFLISERDRQFLKMFCLSLITFLKSKKVRRVHCGCSSQQIERQARALDTVATRQIIVDEAWHALHAACRRGPFAFCDYDLLANPKHFPLQPLSRSTVAKLQRRWVNHESFALVYFQPDFEPRERLDDIVLEGFVDDTAVADESGYLIIKPGASSEEAYQWALQRIAALKEKHGDTYSLSAGVSQFPFRDYPRSHIIRNCQKALVHGSFFGPASAVIFDSLSLNVSGDVYFGEGDLASAVREYRSGLELIGDDVNLLNSLGVTYALMNRTPEAVAAFNSALAIEPDNFMALYNKGLSEQSMGRYTDAVKCFRAARSAYKKQDQEEAGAINDLNYQLGVALFQEEEYRECINQLKNWHENQADRKIAGKCSRYIGLSYYQTGDPVEASKWLQRSLSFDEFDAESMSVLGELYLRRNEGDEIALRLCEKSVEIDGTDISLILRYAIALAACGQDDDALEWLKRCVRRKKTKYQAWYELALIHERKRNRRLARNYVNKLIKTRDVPDSLRLQASQLCMDN